MHLCIILSALLEVSHVLTDPFIRVPRPGSSTEVFHTPWTCVQVRTCTLRPHSTPPSTTLNKEGGSVWWPGPVP